MAVHASDRGEVSSDRLQAPGADGRSRLALDASRDEESIVRDGMSLYLHAAHPGYLGFSRGN